MNLLQELEIKRKFYKSNNKIMRDKKDTITEGIHIIILVLLKK